MISDVLSDAVASINRYLNDSFYDQVYEGFHRDKILKLIESMNSVRIMLDASNKAHFENDADLDAWVNFLDWSEELSLDWPCTADQFRARASEFSEGDQEVIDRLCEREHRYSITKSDRLCERGIPMR